MNWPPRVLHVIPSLSPGRGGTTSAVLQMIEGLQSKGVRCEVAASDDDGFGRRLPQDAPERSLLSRHYFPKRTEFWTWTPKFRAWLKAHAINYDLLHIHGLFSHLNGAAGQIARASRIPYMITPHGMANHYGMRHKPILKGISFRLVERPLLEGAAVIHMTTRTEQREFSDLHIATPLVRIPLAVNPVALQDPIAARSRYAPSNASRIAVFVGRIDPIKNLESLIDALALLRAEGWRLVVCGDGATGYVNALKLRSEQMGVASAISWLGFAGEDEKAKVFAAGDVYVQPSHSESFGIAAVEAVSAGLPCVLGARVAVAEDLVDAGFAVATQPTAAELATALLKASQLRDTQTDYVTRSRIFVTKNFGLPTVSDRLLAAYKHVVEAD